MAKTHIPKGTAVVLSLDPGVVTAGWCLWEKRFWASEIRGIQPPLRSGVISLRGKEKRDNGVDNVAIVMALLKRELQDQRIVKCYCEMPLLFAGSKGHAAAARGDLTDIAFMVGRVAEWMHSIGAGFTDIPASEWKGQMPKLIVNGRIADILGSSIYSILSAAKSHDWDACGIGLYAQNDKVFG